MYFIGNGAIVNVFWGKEMTKSKTYSRKTNLSQEEKWGIREIYSRIKNVPGKRDCIMEINWQLRLMSRSVRLYNQLGIEESKWEEFKRTMKFLYVFVCF